MHTHIYVYTYIHTEGSGFNSMHHRNEKQKRVEIMAQTYRIVRLLNDILKTICLQKNLAHRKPLLLLATITMCSGQQYLLLALFLVFLDFDVLFSNEPWLIFESFN